ncbi:HPt (histidine-containing phosphotransfer) domain-containing protein [Lutibacter agarilyticus]|uniref:HPt (Histidine-containing phosphotransfer) domain-containing protein n=1 Tax=Lutibacter agarilyticus TaxID=1109740 RepID=A0A238XZW2_9FLAO|nr:Hpt domain-containing protein [Lutibacter agarilyticus]SNR64061.1 HPt (histidine-containing phosphotransfer) domain-containing protein [Lutibacter agarilyticus]
MQFTPNSDLPADKPYDLTLIDKMCRGNQEQVAKMVKVFVNEVSQSVKEINLAYSEKDFPAIKKLTHKVKPTLTYFGVEKLQKELLQLEALLLKDFEIAELESSIQKLTSLTTMVVEKMNTDF